MSGHRNKPLAHTIPCYFSTTRRLGKSKYHPLEGPAPTLLSARILVIAPSSPAVGISVSAPSTHPPSSIPFCAAMTLPWSGSLPEPQRVSPAQPVSPVTERQPPPSSGSPQITDSICLYTACARPAAQSPPAAARPLPPTALPTVRTACSHQRRHICFSPSLPRASEFSLRETE